MHQGSPHQPITLHMRDDLRVSQQVCRGERFFVVGDLLAGQFYQLNEQEFSLLQSFDGESSLDEIKRRFETRFHPARVTHHEIQSYLIDFHRKSLLAGLSANRGVFLYELMGKNRHRQRKVSLSKVLAFRWRGINPQSAFQSLAQFFGWLFSPPAVICNLILVFLALGVVLSNYSVFVDRLPRAQEFFGPGNWIPLALTLILMKVLHEIGHGIVLTKFGARCHELGIMLLVFMPTLYVNTTDSWRISSKWRRAYVAAAGVYVEVSVAALATLAWWYSKPGFVQAVLLNIMFLGSVSAILFNGNPLIKFDAYHILSDLIEIPNLQQRSARFLRNSLLAIGFGIRAGDDDRQSFSTRLWLASYGVLSFGYRIFLVFAITFLVISYFRPLGLVDFAKLFSTLLVATFFLAPVWSLFRYFCVPGQAMRINRLRSLALTACCCLGLAAFFALPVRDRITCEFVVEPSGLETVYARHEAILEEVLAAPFQHVQEGDPIARLRNIDIELEIVSLGGEAEELKAELRLMKLARESDAVMAVRSRNLRTRLDTVHARLSELNAIQEQMLLRAPRNGTLLSIWRLAEPQSVDDMLPTWDGETLKTENLATSFERGQPIFAVGDLRQQVAKLIIDQSDVRLVTPGQAVRLLLDSRSAEPILATIDSISEADSKAVTASVTRTFGGGIETRVEEDHGADATKLANDVTPANAVYVALAELPKFDHPIESGLRGIARVDVGKATLFERVRRFAYRTFRISW